MKVYEMFLLCCPLLSPQMIGTLLVAPLILNVSVLQTVSRFGWAMLNEAKSNLKSI